MEKTQVVTARVSGDLLAQLDRIAVERDRTRSWVVARLLTQAAKQEIDFYEFVQKGVDDIEAGRTIPHDELITRLKQRWLKKKAA